MENKDEEFKILSLVTFKDTEVNWDKAPKIIKAIHKNEGFCPCNSEKSYKTSCPCEVYLDTHECHCSLYKLNKIDNG